MPPAKPFGKILLLCAPSRVVVFASNFRLDRFLPPLAAPIGAERSAPPTPPPRAAA
jgi:hypothetical protein